MKILMVKKLNNSLVCAFDSDFEEFKKIKANETIEVEIVKKRNIKFHRKFYALIKMVYQNQEQYSNIQYLRKDLIIESGFYEIRYGIHGEEIKEAKSISFASMNEFEFSELYNSVLDTIVRCFNFDRQDIIENVEKFF